MIDPKTLRELIKLMVQNDLTELDLQDKTEQVRLKRGTLSAGQHVVHLPAPMAALPSALPSATAPANPATSPAEPHAPATADDDLVAITSPMVGTFYSSPSPDAEPFIAVGARVGAETVVCLIEAMKVFNEIKAELSGKVEKILVESGQAVEFGQPLFLVKP